MSRAAWNIGTCYLINILILCPLAINTRYVVCIGDYWIIEYLFFHVFEELTMFSSFLLSWIKNWLSFSL